MTEPSEQYVMKLIGGVPGLERYPELLEHVDRFVTRYEPELAPKGEQWIWTTDDPAEALGFDDAEQLHRHYARAIGTRPWDGRPDRPITAFHVQVAKRAAFP